MNVPLLALLAIVLCGGCASHPSASAPAAHTLAGDRRLPVRDIERQFGPAQWQKLAGLEYEALVMFDARIRADGSLRLEQVRESYPDASWHDLARALSAEAKLQVSTVGTRLEPAAEVVVVFFKRAFDGNLVLIFAGQKDEPAPGTTERAIYLHTRRYDRD